MSLLSVIAIILIVQFTAEYDIAYSDGNILVYMYYIGIFKNSFNQKNDKMLSINCCI